MSVTAKPRRTRRHVAHERILSGNPANLYHQPHRGDKMLRPTLILNASFEPITITTAKRALVLVFKGLAVIEQLSGLTAHSKYVDTPIPSVIRMLEYRSVPKQSRALSRKNILLRDRYTCQYCLQVFPSSELTLDHVHPRSAGGPSVWENLVAACVECNHRKGNKTPEEAGMKLARQPKPFTLHTSRYLLRMSGEFEETWKPYLFY